MEQQGDDSKSSDEKEAGDKIRGMRLAFEAARGRGDIAGMETAFDQYIETAGITHDSAMRIGAWSNVILRARSDAGLKLEGSTLNKAAAAGLLLMAQAGSGAPGPAKAKGLPDSALVCRGGLCTADRFAAGSGVKLDASGRMSGASVNSATDKTLKELSATIENKKLGVTTVGDVRRAGGDVVLKPTPNNPHHCEMCGITPQQAEKLFTPVVSNPNR